VAENVSGPQRGTPEGSRSPGRSDDVDRSFSRAAACIAAITTAPPDMSIFISAIPADGLMEIPPESNVTPFPTSTTGPFPGAAWGARSPSRYSITSNRGGRCSPGDTEESPHPERAYLPFVEYADFETASASC